MGAGVRAEPAASWTPGAVPFVGRLPERARLDETLAIAQGGHPRTIIIEGDAGVGKSRLAQVLVTEAKQRGWRVLAGVCHDDLAVPFLPLRSALADLPGARAAALLVALQPGRAPLPGTPESRVPSSPPVFTELAEVLVAAAREQPLILLLEDVHWADHVTLDLVAHMLAEAHRRALGEPVALVVALTTRTPLAPSLTRLARDPVANLLRLRGLDELELNALITAAAPAPPSRRLLWQLRAATDGNPLLTLSLLHRLRDEGRLAVRGGELVEAAGDEVLPAQAGLDSELLLALDRASPPCRELLCQAAILGDGQPLEHLHLVGGAAIDDLLDEADTGGLLTDDGTRYQFVHPQLRQLLSGRLSGRRRQRLHLQAADALEAGLGARGAEWATTIAHHLRRSGPLASGARIHRWNRLAGDQAYELAAWAEAAVCYDAALETAPGVPAPELFALLQRAARAHFRNHDLVGARRCLEAVVRQAEALGDTEALVDASLLLVQANFTLDSRVPGRRADTSTLDALLERLGPEDGLLKARTHSLLSECCFAGLDTARGMAHARDALHLARVHDDHWTSSEVEFAIGLQQLAVLDLRGAEVSFHRSIEHAKQLGDPWPSAWGLGRLPAVHLLRGRIEEARRQASEVAELTASYGDWAEHSLVTTYLVVARFLQGHLEEAERLARLAALAYLRSDYSFTPPLLFPALAAVRATGGDAVGARAALDEWQELADRGTYPYRIAVEVVAGDRDELARLVGDRPWRRERGDGTIFTLGAVGLQVEVADALEDRELAMVSIGELQRCADAGIRVTPGWPMLVPRLLGLAHLLEGDVEVASGWLQHAAGAARAAGAPIELATVRFAQARAALAQGERRPALERLADGHVLALRHGAAALAARIRDLAEREELALPATAEGAAVVLLCTDIVGSTELNARVGDEEFLRLLREHNRLARSSLRRFGGVEFKHVGDGLFAWFRSADDAVAAGLDMVAATERYSSDHPDRALHLRVGLAAGRALTNEGDLFGLAVVQAVRVTATCRGGDVRVDHAVAGLLQRADVALRSCGRHELKGIPGEVELFEATAPVRTVSR